MAETSGSKSILSSSLDTIATIFSEKNIQFEIPLIIAIIADLAPFFGIIAGFPYLSTAVKFISDIFPSTSQIAFMATLFFIVFGFSLGLAAISLFKLIPLINLFPFFTFWVVIERVNSSSSSTPGDWYKPGTKQYSSFSILVRVFACIVLVIMLFSAMANSANQVLGNVPASIAVPLYGQALPVIESQYDKAAQTIDTIKDPRKWYDSLGSAITNTVKAPRLWLDNQLSIATGGYYQGQVDKYADKNLGVFITEFKSAEQSFYLGTGDTAPLPIQAYATVAGAALEVDDCDEYPDSPAEGSPVGIYNDRTDCLNKQKIAFSCKIPNKRIDGKTNPVYIDLFEIQDSSAIVDCTFNKTKFCKPSTEIVEFYAKFPFKTKSYLKTYIMDTLRYRDMKRQKMDPLLYYKITDTRPTAVYTGGPVMIGIGINDVMPMTVSTTDSDYKIPEGTTDTPIRSYSIGITLQNKWKGKIAEVTDILVVVPPELSFKCSFFEPKALSTDMPGEYVLSENAKKQIKGEGGIKTSKTFNCRISATSAEAARALLNNVPLATKYIQVTAEYQYEISQSTTLRLKSGDGEKMSLSDCNKACEDYDGCYCDVDCAPNYLAEVSHGFSCNNKYTSFPDPAPASGCVADTGATVTKELTAEEKEKCAQIYSQCEYYETSELCTRDMCSLGSCSWNGNACVRGATASSSSSGSVTSITATKSQVVNYLANNGASNLKDYGSVFYDSGVANGVDPAFGIAIARQESSLGKNGVLAPNCNNFFGLTYEAAKNYGASQCSQNSRFASFSSSSAGIQAFFSYFKNQYISRGQYTVPDLIADIPNCDVSKYPCCASEKRCYCCDDYSGYQNWLNNVPSFRSQVSK